MASRSRLHPVRILVNPNPGDQPRTLEEIGKIQEENGFWARS